ncbi:Fpg/Nei family DNA glycosylase [Cellulomonas fengjieae]|uniref:DNA-(apurinic or apyrimidinic site) lyase n=1 Tax=Cellulomonas fengjieae TaxID=2819978 RepID=A0ABS3SC47_9CELL|nr:DNA-formamidopyrimidine glycosylase family protein [Cellulomonas fengjieae]MBO3083084.1 Fpg/Nei family DNA glycosylase [Cellulomonas fengjieae]MBO3102169.1 Fpg/Nei family DNA glycosylase [Cellulomonas fengjieae]QVI65549.1 Fpg/Nei family DNA glycosylase [Cellulomonas fengjieae]
MPEGHTVHRIARQLGLDLVGRRLAVSSPQGRFAAGAARLDGQVLVSVEAVGKQLFCTFERGDVLRVHLGLYGAWDFHGLLTPLVPGGAAAGSLGAPRVRSVVRMGEDERESPADEGGLLAAFPPDPVGQVRVRLASDVTVADLRGPTACEVLDPEGAAAAVARLGPDPASTDDPAAAGEVMVQRLTSRNVAVGQLLMDQTVVAGIGNIYRAEMLFRARLDPHTPGGRVPVDVARALWDDWCVLLADGIRTGIMLTRDDLGAAEREAALTDPSLRHWVYHRTGLPCLVSGTPVVVEEMAGRKLYWCPTCQV